MYPEFTVFEDFLIFESSKKIPDFRVFSEILVCQNLLNFLGIVAKCDFKGLAGSMTFFL